MQDYSQISCAFIPRLSRSEIFKRTIIFQYLTLLEKLSDEFGLGEVDNSDVSLIQEETCMPNNSFENSSNNKQPSCLGDSSSPAIKQQSCSGESSSACL